MRIIDHGRKIKSQSRVSPLEIQLRRPCSRSIQRGIEANGLSYSTGTRPCPSFESRDDLNIWASDNNIRYRGLTPLGIAIIDALYSLSEECNDIEPEASILHLNIHSLRYNIGSTESTFYLSGDLYLPQ